jgi:glycosyltransferase involved in cell wall biosynthesis
MILSIIISVFNEEKTIEKIIERMENVLLKDAVKQIIIVDDCSTDNTKNILKKFEHKYLILHHGKNMGKGAAIKIALPHIKGEYAIIQDADLEYNPNDWPALLDEMKNKNIAAVYGSRNLNNKTHGYFSYYLGGKFLTFLVNLLFGGHLTDINTGYKLFRAEILKSLNLQSNGFEFCEEVTVKLLKNNFLIKEVPISYYPRTFEEGKKMSFRDGIVGIWTIIKNRF